MYCWPTCGVQICSMRCSLIKAVLLVSQQEQSAGEKKKTSWDGSLHKVIFVQRNYKKLTRTMRDYSSLNLKVTFFLKHFSSGIHVTNLSIKHATPLFQLKIIVPLGLGWVTICWHQREHQGFGLCHNTLTSARTPRLGLCHNTDISKNTKAWAVSQHTDISENTKALGCVTTHWHQREHQGFGPCHNTLTSARTPKLWAVSQHTDINEKTMVGAVSQHTDISENTKAGAVSQHIDIIENTKALGCVTTHWHQREHQGLGRVTTPALTPARTPRPGLSHSSVTPTRLGLGHNTLTPARTPPLGLGHSSLTTSENTTAWAGSQLTNTSENTTAWAGSQLTNTSENTTAWAGSQLTNNQREHHRLGWVTAH